MNCICNERQQNPGVQKIVHEKIVHIEHELVDGAKRLLKTASDPFSAVMHFLHERPEGTSLSGYVVNKVLEESFEHSDKIPGLIKVLSGHVAEVIRHSNIIHILNEHPIDEKWDKWVIRKKDRVKFEIAREKGKLVIKNIVGLYAIENGMEAQLEKVVVNPPKLEVQLRFGIFSPQRVVDIV